MSSGHDKKELNFELDLLPVISMMSVCICFLLLTAVWTQVGSMNIEQGMGQESTRRDQTQASMWIEIKTRGPMGGEVKFKMMDSPLVPSDLREKSFLVGTAGSGWPAVEKHAAQMKKIMPGLKTALIMPDQKVNYGDVIRVMDKLKTLEIGEIGIAPL
jgi:biopolymer transport protein TolR